jgi:putative PIN family toxin of toxin-antitoxin system
MSEFRFVVDTNVLISAALLSRSVPRLALDAILERGRLLTSEETLIELEQVLRRSKFDRYLREELRLEFLAAFLHQAELVDIVDIPRTCRDPRDDKFLALALSGQASHLISGDADLLILNPFQGISVITPQDALMLLRSP